MILAYKSNNGFFDKLATAGIIKRKRGEFY